MEIRIDDLSGKEIQALLAEHLQGMYEHSPPESVHALDLTELKQADITVWSAWQNGALLGCGALKELNLHHAEIKSMRTASDHLRKGVAKTLLKHIIEVAKNRSYQRLSLETGSAPASLQLVPYMSA